MKLSSTPHLASKNCFHKLKGKDTLVKVRCAPSGVTTERSNLILQYLSKFDKDGDGKISFEEAKELITDLQANPGTAAMLGVSQPSPPPAAPPKPLTWDLYLRRSVESSHKQGGWLPALISFVHNKMTQQAVRGARLSDSIWAAAGIFTTFMALGWLGGVVHMLPGVGAWHRQGLNLMIGSFGTLAVLLFGAPHAEPIRPWNLVAGHFVAVAAVLASLQVFGATILGRAVGMAAMIGTMLWCDCVHPPGGALVLMAIDSTAIQSLGPWFALYPSLVFTGLILLPLSALVLWARRRLAFDLPGTAAPAPPQAISNNGNGSIRDLDISRNGAVANATVSTSNHSNGNGVNGVQSVSPSSSGGLASAA